MEPTIFRFIFRFSRREQLLLLAFTVAGFPFLYLSLELPKLIINEAIGGQNFPREILGYSFEQIPFLMALCTVFLSLVFINGGFKYFTNVYRGIVGERMLRRLRFQLFNHVLRFPMPQFRKMSQGEIVSMVTGETEPLGGFIGDSIALPAFQGGTLLTILIFMFVQDPVLGVAAIALYPLQAYFIPKLQRRVNQLRKERIVKVRKLSERIGEVVSGIRDVHTHDTSQFELADFSRRVGEIYYIRCDVYRLKFFIKFINNFIAQITPFFFYSIGGYLVIKGELSFGALVAVLAAYKDLSAPWKELLNYYQTKEDARVKYDLLVDTFQPAGMLDENQLNAEPIEQRPLLGELVASNLDLTEEDESETTFAGNLSLKLDLPTRVAILGGPASGKERLAAIIAGIKRPSTGSLSINGVDVLRAPRSVTGRRVAYVGNQPSLYAGTVGDNLYYGLKHRPTAERKLGEAEREARDKQHKDAVLAGNSEHDIDADWIDYGGAGVGERDELAKRAIEVLTSVDMSRDVYQLGLQGTIDPERRPQLAARVLEARTELRHRLQDPDIAPLVELFDRDAYNANLTVAENLLFGTPRDDAFDLDNLADNAYVRKILDETGLTPDLVRVGRRVGEIMVDLFADVAPDSELFERFSFIDADQLPEVRTLLGRTAEAEVDGLDERDLRWLLSLPFKLIPARHRLGLMDEYMRERLVEARLAFAAGFAEGEAPVEFFDRDHYSAAISLQDNILFGKLAYGKARSAARIGELISDVVDKLGLRQEVVEVGLDFPVGIGGSRLSAAQRQKLAIARGVLKRPDILILDEVGAVLDAATQSTIVNNLLEEFRERALIWILQRASLGKAFDYTIVMEEGKVVEQGRFTELDQPGSRLNALVASG